MDNKHIRQIIDLIKHFSDYIEKIADNLCITKKTVIKWEQNITKPSKRNQKNINKMYKELKTDPHYWESESEMLERKYGYW